VLNEYWSKRRPWFIVPANKKWFRNLAVAEALRNALIPFGKKWLEEL
jgi:polyphosphate kinase 2 (PPK2 family)